LICTNIFFTWGPYASFHGMALTVTLKVSWSHLRIFLNSKFYHFMFKCWILLKPVLGGMEVSCTFHYRPWTDLIKPTTFSILSFWTFLGILYFSLFYKVFNYSILILRF
jgi:hypothetical protein